MSTTYFDTIGRSFKDVTVVDEQINTTEFLEAAESLVKLFDVLESATFGRVQADMTGNIEKIRKRQLQFPDKSKTLQEIVLSEVTEKKKSATQALLWLNRGLEFTASAMFKSLNQKDQELVESFTKAYGETLSKHHNFAIRPIFKVAMNACPYRKDFYAKLGEPLSKVEEQLDEWLAALEVIVTIINAFLSSGNYAKGL